MEEKLDYPPLETNFVNLIMFELNKIGLVYPNLSLESRKTNLRKALDFLSRFRYDHSQNYVEIIQEPWLVADIVISENLYWCGYERYISFLRKNQIWNKFQKNSKDIKSAFWLSYTIIHPKYSSLNIRTKFYEINPVLLDRTKDAVAAIIYDRIESHRNEKNYNLEGIAKELIKYDPMFHKEILEKINEQKWIKLN